MRTTYNLQQALSEIAKRKNINLDKIIMIEFEDGSGYKFNYTTKDGIKKFILL